jgi:Tyrosine phosphatase family
MGRIGDATPNDLQLLFGTTNTETTTDTIGTAGSSSLQIKTLVDLRSPTELKDDWALMRSDVFDNFTNIVWQERKSVTTKRDCLRILPPQVGPVQYKDPTRTTTPSSPSKFWQRRTSVAATTTNDTDTELLSTSSSTGNVAEATPKLPDNVEMIIATYVDNVDDDENVLLPETLSTAENEKNDDDDEECGVECFDEPPPTTSSTITKERYFVSLMNEFKYVKGTVSRVRKRDITAAILKSPGAVFSRRIRSSLKQPFLNKINDGGLLLLNELLFKFGAPGIRYVLQLCSDTSKHPIAFYCTAGKDRTGAIAAIILSLCGTQVEDIVEDYSLSANVYAEMNDHQAMVGALSQRNLDPKTFLCAPPTVMRTTIDYLNREYGSVENYCTAIGFTKEQQEQLIKACVEA